MAKKILIVDDEAESVEFLKHFFAEKGLEVYTAANGRLGVDAVRHIFPDIVLLDIKMPLMDGIQALKEIKASRHSAKVIMLTAVEDGEKMEEALRLGADNYIMKPFILEYLEKRVQDLIEN